MSKEFKVGDKVRALVSSAGGGFLEGYIYEVSNIYKNYSYERIEVALDSLGVVNDWLSDNFELVESFDDLIDVAIQAVKDDVIVIRRFHSSLLNFEKIGETNHASDVEVTRSSGVGKIQDAIDFIRSLYIETFVIDSEADIEKTKPQSEGDLSNGVSFLVKSAEKCHVRGKGLLVEFTRDKKNFNTRLYLDELKGATITQKKDIK